MRESIVWRLDYDFSITFDLVDIIKNNQNFAETEQDRARPSVTDAKDS